MIKRITLLFAFGIFIGCSHGNITTTHQQPVTSDIQIDKEKIRSTVKDHIGEIKKCYEKALDSKPKLMGKFVFQWTIEPSGNVSEAHIKSSSFKSTETEIEKCAIAKFKSWKFPSPPNGEVAIVSYPFSFQGEE